MGGSSAQYNFDQPGSSSNLLAGILKQQYANFQQSFVPEENKLISYATDPNTIPNAQKRAMADASGGFAGQRAGMQKYLNTRGIQLPQQEMDQMNRRTQINQSAGLVDAANRAGVTTYDTINNVLAGSQSPTAIPGVGLASNPSSNP